MGLRAVVVYFDTTNWARISHFSIGITTNFLFRRVADSFESRISSSHISRHFQGMRSPSRQQVSLGARQVAWSRKRDDLPGTPCPTRHLDEHKARPTISVRDMVI
ncbi:hypothetical protein EON65_34560 [archaeon]|nr:MAG: hypothetical protein EON65_34560 [archaeon]